MIRKVPNMKAWVLQRKDYSLLRYLTNSLLSTFELPLFDSNPIPTASFLINDDELMLVAEVSTGTLSFTLEQVEEINKTWNKFYE